MEKLLKDSNVELKKYDDVSIRNKDEGRISCKLSDSDLESEIERGNLLDYLEIYGDMEDIV